MCGKKRNDFRKQRNNADAGFDICEDFDAIIDSFLTQYGIYLPDYSDADMSAQEFMHRIAGLGECRLSRLVHARVCTDREAEYLSRSEKEERVRWKKEKREEEEGTDYGEMKKQIEMRALWESLTRNARRVPAEPPEPHK